MATKFYGIKDNWTDDDVANVIEVASEDGSVSSVKVNGVEYGGGGGGLDVNHLALTIVNNTANAVNFASDLVDSLNNLLILSSVHVLYNIADAFPDIEIASGNSATIILPYRTTANNYVALNKGNLTIVASDAINCDYTDDEYYPEIDVGDYHESSSITITIS